MYLIGSHHFVEAMAELGYPRYFMMMLGATKFLGVAALLARAELLPKTLRELAAQAFTGLLAAIISHLALGKHVPPPIFTKRRAPELSQLPAHRR